MPYIANTLGQPVVIESRDGGGGVLATEAVARAELINYARAHPGKLSYGTWGIGTSHHFSGEEIQRLTGIKMVQVSYKSGVG